MKSQLDARPVYLQKQDTIVGHFLICYLAVLLTRLLQFKILKNGYSSEELFEFVRNFRVAKISDRKYINLSRGTSFIREKVLAMVRLQIVRYHTLLQYSVFPEVRHRMFLITYIYPFSN